MKTSVFAVDVGYGNTKFAFRMGSDIGTHMFPSLTPEPVTLAVSDFGDGILKGRKVVTIEINGVPYEIGPGVDTSASHGSTKRSLHEDFCVTDQYAALLGGAFHFSDITDVDRLVLGLPVHTISKYSAQVKAAFTGTLDFGYGKVRVGDVKVVPQPLGSLVSFAEYGGQLADQDDAHLVVDVGYFTTDWVVANGFTMNDRRSGGAQGGASQVYKQIAALISKHTNLKNDDLEGIDRALRLKKKYFFSQRDWDLSPFLEQAQSIITSTVSKIKSSVGRTSDLRSLVMTGGGAELYLPAIREAIDLPIELLASPCYANVRGFLIVGEATLAQDRKIGAAA